MKMLRVVGAIITVVGLVVTLFGLFEPCATNAISGALYGDLSCTSTTGIMVFGIIIIVIGTGLEIASGRKGKLKVESQQSYQPAPQATSYCRNCGNTIDLNSKFCKNCGAPKKVSPSAV